MAGDSKISEFTDIDKTIIPGNCVKREDEDYMDFDMDMNL